MTVYLDHAASTPMKPEVTAAMQPYLSEARWMANPMSAHADGRACRSELESLRARAAARFACRPEAIVFNSGGSEGDTHALFGAARLLMHKRGPRMLRIGISALEHEAVRAAAMLLVDEMHELVVLPVTSAGVLPPEVVEQALREERFDIISVMSVNNEIGTVQPVGEIARLCSAAGCIFHTDAVRAVGHGLPEIESDPGIPLLNCTGHKFGGPRGAGILIQRGPWAGLAPEQQHAPLAQHVCGGHQEQGARAGTENLASIAGLVHALELATAEEAAHIEELRVGLEASLQERWPGTQINGAQARRATHITSLCFPPELCGGRSGPQLAAQLDALGFAVGAGAACQSESGSAGSHTLRAMGVPGELANATLRISLGWSSTQAEIDSFFGALQEVLA
ncbi:cysteine desulfurase [bacterium]|nr:cysteine desulfurase [bacterium]